jgi:predicted dehydrogenase
MKKMRIVIFGTGFMGRVHTEGVRRLGNVEVAGIAARTKARARQFADDLSIERATSDYREFLADPGIDAVHICTPNSLHFEMARDALGAGKHEAGELGAIQIVQGTYSQDWLLYDTDWNRRVETGPSRAFADIGTHWCDMVEHVTGLRLSSLCADLQTFHKTRQTPTGDVSVTTEDFGSMIFRLGDNGGAMTVSEVSAGRRNRLSVEVYRTKSSLAWNAEQPDELWIGRRDAPNEVVVKDPALLHEKARDYADLPGGHSEGYADTFKQAFRRFYLTVADRTAMVEYPTFEDGLRQMEILDAVLESSRNHAWVNV